MIDLPCFRQTPLETPNELELNFWKNKLLLYFRLKSFNCAIVMLEKLNVSKVNSD